MTTEECEAALQETGPSRQAGDVKRIVELQRELALWKERAHTDPVSGLLNERAHIALRNASGTGHGVVEVHDVAAVYDYCGQKSGNTFMRDLGEIIQQEAERGKVLAFRIGTAKLAFIAESMADVEAFMAALERVLNSLVVTGTLGRGQVPEREVVPEGGMEAFLRAQKNPFAMEWRLRRRQAPTTESGPRPMQ